MGTNTLFGQPAAPATLVSDTGAYTFGLQFTLSQAAPLTGIWFYSAPGAGALPDHCGIFAVSGHGAVTGTVNNAPSWSGAAGSGWVKCTYDGSTILAAATSYKVAVAYAGGSNFYSASSHYWDTTGAGASGLTSGIITAPNNAGGDGGQDTFVLAVGLTYPGTSFNATNYWLDVEVSVPSAARLLGCLAAGSRRRCRARGLWHGVAASAVSGSPPSTIGLLTAFSAAGIAAAPLGLLDETGGAVLDEAGASILGENGS